MADISPKLRAGMALRSLISSNYTSQEEFAYDYGLDIRSVSMYINEGIGKVDTIQELAEFFHVDFIYFFTFSSSTGPQSR